MRAVCRHSIVVVAMMTRWAAAGSTTYQLDGAVNLGATQQSQTVANQDPMADPADVKSSTTSSVFSEIRPGVALQNDSARLSWRFAYLFSGILNVATDESLAYTNSATLSVSAVATKFVIMGLAASIAQGGNTFLLGQRAADLGQPEIRGNPNANIVTANAAENLAWEMAKQWTLQQGLIVSSVAPIDQLEARNTSLTGTLAVEHVYAKDMIGLEARAGIARLRQQLLAMPDVLQPQFSSYTASLRARWNHDYSRKWNTLATAGVGEVFTDTGSRPLAIFPVGSLTVRYSINTFAVGLLDFAHDTDTNLQVGTVSLADRLTVRGVLTFDPDKLRALSFSGGVLHNQPIGESSVLVTAATGTALQTDVGFTTLLRKNLIGTVRYTLAYQFGQEGSAGPSLSHILFIGVTGTYTNAQHMLRPVPIRGKRVDGSDGKGFPVIDDPIDDTPPSGQ